MSVLRSGAAALTVAVLVAFPAASSVEAQCLQAREFTQLIQQDFASYGTALAKADFDYNDMEDVIIGVPGAEITGVLGAGCVEILNGPDFLRRRIIDHPLPVQDDHFGSAVAAADFDDDGEIDVAVGAPLRDHGGADDGSVFVFYGPTFQNWTEIIAPASGGSFGSTLLAAPVRGNKLPDLLVAAHLEMEGGNPDVGAVHVYEPAGRTFVHQDRFTVAGSVGAELFGTALAAGDFDGDGTLDLAAGAPGFTQSATAEAGVVLWWTGPVTSANSPTQIDPPTVSARGWFGISLDSGDVQYKDGTIDLVVGASGADAGSGRIYVGDGAVFTNPIVLQACSWENYSHFGDSVAVGDFNGDGDLDVLGGEPDACHGNCDGEVGLWYGPGFTTCEAFLDPSYDGMERMGDCVLALDSNDDAIDELVVGAPMKVRFHDYGSVMWFDISGEQPFVRYGKGLAGGGGTPDLFGTGSGKGLSPGELQITGGLPNDDGALAIGMERAYWETRYGQMVLGQYTFWMGIKLDGSGQAKIPFTYPRTLNCRIYYAQVFLREGWSATISHTNGLQIHVVK